MALFVMRNNPGIVRNFQGKVFIFGGLIGMWKLEKKCKISAQYHLKYYAY